MQKYVNLVDLVKTQELSNEYLLAKIGVDTAENEPLKVWRKIQFIIHSPSYSTDILLYKFAYTSLLFSFQSSASEKLSRKKERDALN